MTNILDQHARPSTPFLHTGGPIGILIVHGFLGSPHELQPLAERLAKDGHTVRVILLPGHGQNPEHLKGIAWQVWADHVQSELELLKRSSQKTVLIGFSMGGLLSLLKAATGQCDALVTMAPALELRLQKQMVLAGFMKFFMPWMYPFKDADFDTQETRTNIRQYIPDADFSDQILIARLRAEVRIPLAAIGQLIAVQNAVKPLLKDVRVPLLVVQGRLDKTVNPGSAQTVFDRVSSSQKEIRWFEGSGHMLMYEGEGDEICQTVSEWVGKTMT